MEGDKEEAMLQRIQSGLKLEHLVLLMAAAGIKLKESRNG